MNLMCFADHLNSLLLIFCFFSFILALLFHFIPTFNIMSKRMHFIQKYVVFNMLVIAYQNTSASLYSILTYQIKFPPPHRAIKFSRIFQPPPPPPVYSNTPSPPHLLSFEESSNPPPRLFQTPVLLGTQE